MRTEASEKNQEKNTGPTIVSGSYYKLLGILGHGGMGSVWKALRTTSGGHKQTVAIKIVRDKYDETLSQALIREARRISELRHDNIVSFVDSGITRDNQFFVALEYIPGLDLNQLMELHRLNKKNLLCKDKPSRIPDQIVGFILLMATRALEAAHAHVFNDGKTGLVNRDISPDNFVIERNHGFVKQIDFGVAETIDDIKAMYAEKGEERKWSLTGKLFYMAPEEIKGEQPDARTDIYALGLVGRKLITGFDQFDSLNPNSNFMKCLYHVMSAQAEPLVPLVEIVTGVDEELDSILMKMTHPDREKRYSNATTMKMELEDYLYAGKGKGPTVTSLQTYMRLMKDRPYEVGRKQMESINFLRDSVTNKIMLNQPCILTDNALKQLKDNINPAVANSD